MAGKIRHLVDREGRYFARIVVPKDLRPIVGKTELRTPLGGDRRQAVKYLPGAVAEMQGRLGEAERRLRPASDRHAPPRYPLTRDQIAKLHYQNQEDFDAELRLDPRYASFGFVDENHVAALKMAVAGRLYDDELQRLIGPQIERYRKLGHHETVKGTDEWRKLAMILCHAELEALHRVAERDDGIFDRRSEANFAKAKLPEEQDQPVPMVDLWDRYAASRKQAGFMRGGDARLKTVIVNLKKFVRHDDAARLTKSDIIAWRNRLIETKAATTVSNVYLSTLRSMLRWACENDILKENVAADVRQPKPRKVKSREKGYRDDEALAIIKASRSYQPATYANGKVREVPSMIAAKQWVPIICAFTGARVSEITQLRKEDVREVDGIPTIRITPDAGTVKSGGYRDVPLHPQIIEEGFLKFVDDATAGPLFHNGRDPDEYQLKATSISDKLANWVRNSGLRVEGVAPNHGWRHRFKTQGIELGIDSRVIDAIQGHVGRTAGENYGDVTLKARGRAISQFQPFLLKTL